MNENGQYIEPVRLTGKEVTMENGKRKINYPAFAWSQKRQQKLAELYQAGTPIPDIASHFETDEETVYKAIEKYDLVRETHRPTVVTAIPAPVADLPLTADLPQEICKDRPLPSIQASLKDILHFIIDAANHNNDTMAAISEKKEIEAVFELGQQCAKLSEAEKIAKNLINNFPEP